MTDIVALIEQLPLIISYVAIGLLFLKVYYFIRLKKEPKNQIVFFLSCISISLIIKTIYVLFCQTVRIEHTNDMISYSVCFILAIIFAYVCGVVINTKRFNDFLLKIRINRTVNENIWKDVYRDYTWGQIKLKNNPYYYWGEIKYIEEKQDSPKIVLIHYQVIDPAEKKVISNYSKTEDKQILIDTSDIQTIEFTYGLKETDSQKK